MLTNKTLFSKITGLNFFFLLLVICFGAYVRMTGSGAGCGNHWPLCNGAVLPRAPLLQTVIEFTHRLSSGWLLLFCFALVFSSFKSFQKGHYLRKLSCVYLFFLLLEALLGAFLVKYEHVATNRSIYRGFSVSFHLINTFVLMFVASALLYFSEGRKIFKNKITRKTRGTLLLGFFLIILVGLSGAITALGDTLFPVTSVWEALLKSQSTAEHLFVRLRVYHPFLAVFTSFLIIAICYYLKQSDDFISERQSKVCLSFFVLQLFLGYLNVYFHAPHILQLVHLLVALLSWASYSFFCFHLFFPLLLVEKK